MAQITAEITENPNKTEQITPCRTCLDTINIPFNLNLSENKHLLDLLNCLLGFEVLLINGEYIICANCELTLRQLEEFKRTCLKSQENLGTNIDIRTYLESALSSENEAKDNNSSDSDYFLKKTQKKSTRKGKPFVHRQFSAGEVLEAIQQCANFSTDLKYRTCLLCDFIGPDNKALGLHMKYMHDDFIKSWCFRCNLLEYDLESHKDTVRCCQFSCKFCGRNFKKHSRLVEHLRFHCNRTFYEEESKELLTNFEVNSDYSNIKEEIITLKISNEDLDKAESGEDGIIKKCNEDKNQETKQEEDSNDSDSIPLILRLKRNRRFSRRSTRGIKRPVRYKNAFSNNKHKNRPKDDLLKETVHDDIAENDSTRKIRMKCRLKQFDHEEVLQAINDTIKPFKMNRECILCGFVASHARALSVHMTLLHKDLKDNWCNRCNCLVDHLEEHAESHKNDLLKCTFCGRSFNKFFHLKEHLKSHSRLHAYDTETKWYSCKVCPNSYPNEQNLKEHECNGPDPSFNGKKRKKIKNSRFCVACNKRVRSLPIHNKHKHNPNGELKEPSNKLCSICGKTFSDNSKLTVHMRIHTGESPYKCSYCDKRCGTRNHLVVHERTHTGEKPHICYICGKAFAQSSVLGTHMKIHTGRPEQCSVCDQRFCRPAELKLHMRRHTGEKPYLCNDCGLSFHQRSHLVEHVKRHSNERPFKCSFCEKGFKQISVLKAHENIHTGLKPFKCSQCSYSCRQSYSLTVHMKQHANDAPQAERPHKCLICDKQFSTHAMLVSHSSNIHAEIVETDKEFARIESVMDCS